MFQIEQVSVYVDCMGFTIQYRELNSRHPFCVLEKDGLRVNLFRMKHTQKNIIRSSGLLQTILKKYMQRSLQRIPVYCIPTSIKLHSGRGEQRNLPWQTNSWAWYSSNGNIYPDKLPYIFG